MADWQDPLTAAVQVGRMCSAVSFINHTHTNTHTQKDSSVYHHRVAPVITIKQLLSLHIIKSGRGASGGNPQLCALYLSVSMVTRGRHEEQGFLCQDVDACARKLSTGRMNYTEQSEIVYLWV